MDFKLSKNSKKNIKGIDKRLIKLVNRVLAKSDIDFGIPNYGGFRTAQEQNNLFHKRPKVTQLDGFKAIIKVERHLISLYMTSTELVGIAETNTFH